MVSWLLLATVVLCTATAGCMRRRLTVRSTPPGALVYIDDQEIGVTPCSTAFTYYGTREIKLVKDGYETVTAKRTFRPPWYEIPPLDLFSDNFSFSGRETRDERVLDFQLAPQQIVPTDALLHRAENLRSGARAGYVAPLPVDRGGAASPAAPVRASFPAWNPSPTIPPPGSGASPRDLWTMPAGTPGL